MGRVIAQSWLVAGVVLCAGCQGYSSAGYVGGGPDSEPPPDEAKRMGKTVPDFPVVETDVFAGMDYPFAADAPEAAHRLSPEEIQGRNTWILWSGGNDWFWDWLSKHSYGSTDLLKVLDSRYHDQRLEKYGLINEPGFVGSDKPNKERQGLYISSGPQLPGVDPKVYGYSSGVMGLRLFENPEFDAAAQARWDPERFYTDPKYYLDPKLVRPYRVGMSCGFCHVAFHPLKPPADPNHPQWENLSSSIGQQWWYAREVFGSNLKDENFIAQVLSGSTWGLVDTSLIPSDNINNPVVMNPVWQFEARMNVAKKIHWADVSGAALSFPVQGTPKFTPHVLADGADSVGAWAALARVYLNIGTYGEQWIRTHNTLIGFREQRPFRDADATKHSVYWNATKGMAGGIYSFFAKSAKNMRLADAPEGVKYLKPWEQLQRGKEAFAKHCMRCHYSKQDFDRWPSFRDRQGEEYEKWALEQIQQSEEEFVKENFFSTDERIPVTYVGTNAQRALGTNAMRDKMWDDFASDSYKELPSVGSWKVEDPFTGEVWKDPETGRPMVFDAPSHGPGYYRIPPLVGIWATSPLLHNNSVGKYTGDPSVQGRLAVFDDSIHKLLWPERRGKQIAKTGYEDPFWTAYKKKYGQSYRAEGDQGKQSGSGYGTSGYDASGGWNSWILIDGVFISNLLGGILYDRPALFYLSQNLWVIPTGIAAFGVLLIGWGIKKERRALRMLGTVLALSAILVAVAVGKLLWYGIKLGPIPKGTPVSLLANLDPDAKPRDLANAGLKLLKALERCEEIAKGDGTPEEKNARQIAVIRNVAAPALLKVNRAPDFVLDKGHKFGSELSDADKESLIELLKHF